MDFIGIAQENIVDENFENNKEICAKIIQLSNT